MYLKFKKLHENAIVPSRAHLGDLGFDLFALEDTILTGGTVTVVSTGIACQFPATPAQEWGALIRDRSSVATKKEVFVVAGVIDHGYTGEIKVAMFNPGKYVESGTGRFIRGDISSDVEFKAGDKIAQLILIPVYYPRVEVVTELDISDRGDKGFGSSGS
jgi:dUTP pyrophosphatase